MAVILFLLFSLFANAQETSPPTYHGGPILTQPFIKVYLVWWGTPDPTFKAQIETFVGGIGATSNWQVLGQYADRGGFRATTRITFGGSYIVSTGVGGTVGLGPYQIIANAISQGAVYVPYAGSSAGTPLTMATFYAVIGTGSTHFCGGGCGADHGTLRLWDPGSVSEGITGLFPASYANLTLYEAFFNAGYSYGFTASLLFHELSESVTDPFLSGWSGGGSSGGEVADVCQSQTFGNVTIGAYTYSIQPLWSVLANACVFAPVTSMNPSSALRGGFAARGRTTLR